MKPRPMKGKTMYHGIKNALGQTNKLYPHHYDTDIKSAVEWLKEQMFKDDDITPRSFGISKGLIDKAFEDVIKKCYN